MDDSGDWVELQLKHGDAVLSVGGHNWSDAIAKAALGKLKCRVAAAASYTTEYSSETKQWGIVFGKPVGPVKSQIALALLLAFPERLSRKELVKMVDIKLDSLRNYLTKPEKGIKPHIDENKKSGIILNTEGYSWAIGILKSIEETRSHKLKGDDIEQSANKLENPTE